MDIDYENVDGFELQYIWLAASTAMADVSDFKEGEIRSLKPKNPVLLHNIENWDRLLDSDSKLNVGDYGINNRRELFVYTGNKWLQRGKIVNGKMGNV